MSVTVAPRTAPDVYLHVGAAKTGTTFLQNVLWRHRDELAVAGLLYPAWRSGDHYRASLDLQRNSLRHKDMPEPGAWQLVAGRARAWSGRAAVISHETLARARVREISSAMESLSPATVHIIYTVRDLARQLPAVWQESVKNRAVHTYDRFLDAVAGSPTGERGVHNTFWRAQDPVGVLERWGEAVPVDRIHVVTCPPPGSPPETLWCRFADVLGVADPKSYDLNVDRSNPSLGVVETEVVRRINERLAGQLEHARYERTVKFDLAESRLASRPGGERIQTPPEHRKWIERRAEEIIDGLAASGVNIVGDLDDLRPAAATSTASGGREISDAELLDIALEVAGGLLLDLDDARQAAAQASKRTPRQWLSELADRQPALDRLRQVRARQRLRQKHNG